MGIFLKCFFLLREQYSEVNYVNNHIRKMIVVSSNYFLSEYFTLIKIYIWNHISIVSHSYKSYYLSYCGNPIINGDWFKICSGFFFQVCTLYQCPHPHANTFLIEISIMIIISVKSLIPIKITYCHSMIKLNKILKAWAMNKTICGPKNACVCGP